MGLSDKPGVLGTIGTIGQAATAGVKAEVKRTIENSAEQLGMKEKKEGAPPSPDAAAQEAARKQQSQEMTNWLYGITPTESTAPVPEKKPEGQGNLKQQLGIEVPTPNTANIKEQLGVKTDGVNTTANPLEQLGMGQRNQTSASVTEQLNFAPKPALSAEDQAKQQKLQQRLHNDYYQRLVNPQVQQSDTEERQKDAQEEQETPQQRMERQMQEDMQKKQEEAKKKQLDPGIEMAHNMEKNRGSSG